VTELQSLHKLPRVCFKEAIFGSYEENVENGELENKIITNLLGDIICPHFQLTIINRLYRRILNVDDILKALSELHYHNVNVVVLENFNITEQVHLAACTRVLIGVQGAGLAWFRFMQHPAGVLEIGWPGWPASRYTKSALDLGYLATNINNCQAEVTSHSLRWYRKLTSQNNMWVRKDDIDYLKMTSLLSDNYLSNSNIWKFADCTVNVTDFKRTFLQLAQQIKNRS
jgi:adenomatosis polyposis coli protein